MDKKKLLKKKGELETELMRLGIGGLAYTSLWDKVATKLCKVEKQLTGGRHPPYK